VRQVLRAQIELGWGRSELGAACVAWQAATDPVDNETLERLAMTLDATKVVPATREMSMGLGRRTLDLLRRLHPGRLPALPQPHHAIVIGVAGRFLGIDLRALLLAFGHSLAAGTLAAAVRCMPIGPVQAQAALIEVQPLLDVAVTRAIADPQGSLFTCTPALDVRSHQQASLHTRLFQT
jgi:urease accessory protein